MPATAVPAHDHQHNAGRPDDHGVGRYVGDLDQKCENAQQQAQSNDPYTGPWIVWLPRNGGRTVSEFPEEQVQRDQWNQWAVAVFRCHPGPAQGFNADPEDAGCREAQYGHYQHAARYQILTECPELQRG